MFNVRWFFACLIGVALLGGGVIHSTQPIAVQETGPTLTLTPASGPAGTMVTAAGSGYDECLDDLSGDGVVVDDTPPPPSSTEPEPAPGGQVALFWDEAELQPWAEVSDDGTFQTSFIAPASAAPGTHVVVSRCAGSPPRARILASAAFTIPAPPTAQTTLVPNLVGLSPDEAPATLQRAGLELGRTSGSGEVIDSQEPPAGTRVPPGSTVNITLVHRPDRGQSVRVPDLVGRTVNEARVALATVNLILGNNPPDGNSRIQSQLPTAGTLVAQGTRVTVTVPDVAVSPRPGGPLPGSTVPPGSAPTAIGPVPTGQPLPTVQPTTPTSQPAVSPTGKATPWPPWWVFLILPVLILLGVLGSMLANQPRKDRKGPEWVRSHVRVVPGIVTHIGATASEDRVSNSSSTHSIRIIPRRDSGMPVLEVVES